MLDLVKALIKTGSSSAVNIILGVISTKIIAIVLGPNGIGLYSLLRQIVQTASIVGSGGQTALVQGIASKKGKERDTYIVTVFWLFILGAVLVSTLLIIFSPQIAIIVFKKSDLQTINLVKWISLPVFLTIIFVYLTSILNGFKTIGRLALGQVTVAITVVLLTYPTSKLVESGYTIAFILMMSASSFVGIVFYFIVAYKEKWLKPIFLHFKPHFDKSAIKHFYFIAVPIFITGLVTTGVLLIVRAMIVQNGGLQEAGLFDVAWALSMAHVMLFLSSLSTYYAPRIGEIDDQQERVIVIQDTMRLATLVTVPSVVSVIVLKPLVVEILYSTQFTPSIEIMRWMLIGDYLKVASWVLSIPAVMCGHIRTYFLGEILWNAGFLIASTIAIFIFGNIQGIGIGFSILYALYLIYYIHYSISRQNLHFTKYLALPWILGLVIVLLASLETWNSIHINWISAPLWIGTAVLFSWITLNQNERKKIKSVFGQ